MHFSVITPSYQRRALLPETVASVRATITAPLDFSFEHLIYQNGPDDGTAAYLAEATQQPGPPLRYWLDAAARRPGYARNQLSQHAPAEAWLTPLDDDDLLLQRSLYHYAAAIQANPGRRWLVADFLRVDEHGRYLPGEDYYAWRFDSPTAMLTAIFRAEHFIQGNVCYTKDLFGEVGGYDAALPTAEDLDLYVRFLLAGHLPVPCPHYSHLHRFHAANTSQGIDAAKHNADLQLIYKKYFKALQSLHILGPGH
ncbi:MAG: glycosyltransferase family 2 protein [Janthinobacterium lividum]